MLVIGRSAFAAQARWAFAAAVLALGVTAWYAAESWDARRLVGGGSRVGLALGVAGAVIILFELLLWPRKRLGRLRTRRLGRAQTWMKAHIWLGLVCVPVVVLHAGFRLGGLLTVTLLAVFAVVIASGIWGLWMQQVIPRRMREMVPDEVPVVEIDRIVVHHANQFARRLEIARGGLGGEPVPGAELVWEAFEKAVRPYLTGMAKPVELRVADRAGRFFAELRASVSELAHPLAGELEEVCRLRRQLDEQARLQRLLHNWLWVHLPLSVLLVGLLVAHIYVALRYI